MKLLRKAQARSSAGGRMLSVAALVLFVAACDSAPVPEEDLLRPVRYLTIADTVAGRSRTFSGTLKSTRESRLSFKVAGTVTELPVQIGQQLEPRRPDRANSIRTASALQVEQAQATPRRGSGGSSATLQSNL